MPESNDEVERRVKMACGAYISDEFRSIAAACEAFDAPESRVRRRLIGISSKKESGGYNKRLSPDQELAVCHFLDRIATLGIDARKQMVSSIANRILRRAHNDPTMDPPKVGPQWALRFLQRHPEYIIKKKKPLAIERKNAHSIHEI